MNIKIPFFEVHSEDKHKEEFPNISLYSIIAFKENSNGYSTDVKVKKLGWITLSIAFDKFKEFSDLRK